ncbi:cellulase family glycosylhydrolase, partial [Candidatus Dojkabacteria bacterium]|nr:cellulase family glycosylhydrolase [Candidatus Dojkabacteria bacterium]
MAKSPQKTYQLTGLPERMVIMGLLLLVFAVATVQLVKDLNQVDWSRVVAALPAIEEANKLAAAKPADPVTKLSLISDNYSRCQNKLGQMLYEAHKDTVLDKNQVNLELYKFYLTGARYVMIKIYDYNETAKQAVILVSQQAYKNHLVPILYMMSENGTTVDQNIKNTVSFLRAIDEATDALKFIATTSPNSYMNDDNRQVDAVQISIGVAKDLMEFPDIATTTPEMWVDRLSENDRVETLHNLGLGDDGALVPFDYMLLSYQNRDYEYSQGSSDYAMRAYTEFSEPYPNKPDLGKQVFPAKQWLRDENNQVFRQHMQAIIVGFGPPTYKPDEGKLSADPVGQLGYDFGSFSDDPDIAAVIFQGNSESTLNLSSQDLAKINKFGTNCKYDIEVSDFSYPTSAKAAACEVRQSAESPAQADTSTWTKVVCDNVGQPTGTCYAAIYYTVQVGLPIRSFGSNSAIGTETNPYMPVSAYIAYQNGINSLDALNQYAGKLTSTNGQTYTVPWLGNAIYNSSELLRTRFSGGFDPFINGELRYNDSAVAGERIAELNDAYSRDQAAEYDYTSNTTWCYDPSSGLDGRKIVTLDEYALYDGKNFCLDKSQIELIDSLAQYDPIKYAGRQTEVNACNSEVYRVKRDPQNMIYGSEQVLNKEEWFSTKSELCYNAWRGEGNLIDQGINCTASSVPITALNPTAGDCRCQENPGLFASKYNIQNGLCTLTTAQQNSCIQYNSGADSYASASVRLQPQQKLPGADGISSVPKYDIEGAYAALAAVYKNVQDAMSRRGLKIIFNEKLGWESEVILRAYRDTAGEDAQINYGRTNNMLDQFTRNYPSLSAAIAAERGEQSSGSSTFSNSNPKSASSKVCGINIDPGNAGGYPTGGAALSGIGWARLVYKESDAGKMDQYIQELNKAGVNVLLVLNQETYWGDGTNNWNQGDMGAYANAFAAKAAEIAKKYQGQVLAYEIWNEPDGVGEAFAHLEPSQLNTIASSAISAINSADLDAFVVVGGLLGGEGGVVNYIKGMPDAMSKADAISVHPYTKGADDSLGNYLRTILAAKQTVWITEFSWEGSPMSGDPAGYVTSFYDYLATNFSSSVPVAVLYAWSDAMQSDRGNFGIVDASGNPKQPVFDTFYEKGCGAVAPLSSEGSSSGASFSIPGTYMTNLNLYPAEGRNYDVYNEYYQMLGVIDELMRINDVYLNDDFFETGAIQSNGTVFSEDAAETYVGLYGCDSQAYKLALANLVAAGVPLPSLNCIGLVSDHDPVGDFLCEKGYAADNLCSMQCVGKNVVPKDLGTANNPSCPLHGDKCYQDPLGSYTHYCSGAGEVAFDLYTGADETVYVPEDGKVVYAEGLEQYNCTQKTGVALTQETLIKYNESRKVGDAAAIVQIIRNRGSYDDLQSSGGAIGFLGNSGVYYRMRHIDLTTEEAAKLQGAELTGGQPLQVDGRTISLYHVPDEIYTPCWLGAHLHTWAKVGVTDLTGYGGESDGQYVNPYELYTGVLGCGSTAGSACKVGPG